MAGSAGGGAGEFDLAAAAADVKAVAVGHGEFFAVDRDGARGADVQDAELAALGEEFGGQFLGAGEGKRDAGGDGRADDGAVDIDVNGLELAGLEQVIDQEFFPDLLGGHALEADGIRGVTGFHGGVLSSLKSNSKVI